MTPKLKTSDSNGVNQTFHVITQGGKKKANFAPLLAINQALISQK